MEEKIRALKHSFDNHLSTLQEIARAPRFHRKEFAVTRGFAWRQCSAESPAAKLPYEPVATGDICRTAGLTGNQTLSIPTAKRITRKLFRGSVVSLGKQRRHGLPLRLVGKAMHE